MSKFTFHVEIDLDKYPELIEDIDTFRPHLQKLCDAVQEQTVISDPDTDDGYRLDQNTTLEGVIKCNLADPYSYKDFLKMMQASYFIKALYDIGQRVFRPARKHGYCEGGKVLTQLCSDDNDEKLADYGTDLVGEMEDLYYEILEENGINLDEVYY